MGKKYYKHKVENLINIEKIITIHYFELIKSFVGDYESHDFYELVYSLKSDIFLNLDNEKIQLKEGEMIIIKPNVVHSITADNINNPDIFINSFSTKSDTIQVLNNRVVPLNKKMERYIYAIIEESKRTFNIPISDPYTKKMEFMDNRPIGGLQIIKNYLEIMLINILRYIANGTNSDIVFLINENYKSNLSGAIIEYLNNHINESIKIKDLEDKFNYNKSYLFSVFKKQTGHTIIDYFNELKIIKAKQLLSNSKLSIKEISIQLSFDTPSYFCKVFKGIKKITPLQYRRSI